MYTVERSCMKKLFFYFLPFCFAFACESAYSQVKEPEQPFFMKKKGLLKRLGKSIYRETLPEQTIKAVDPFLAFKGKTIRHISIAPTGFNRIIHDTLGVKKTFVSGLADLFHRNTLPPVIRKNLFFKEGDIVRPLLLTDNEHFLRDLPFLQDALIVLHSDTLAPNTVDVIIITRDVFSLGGSLKISSAQKGEVSIKDENILGTGNKAEFSSLVDKERDPAYAPAFSIIRRNIGGSFIDLSAGYSAYNRAFNSGRADENNVYLSLDKPFVSRYTPWTGGASFSYHETANSYIDDSLYYIDFKYRYLTTDIWGGYNIGYRNKKNKDSEKRLRHFVALRSFYNNFYVVPGRFKTDYNYSYADMNGMLLSYTLYRQNFYRANFIYGFGRNEDLPEGITATVIGGYTNKQGLKRPYYGTQFEATHVCASGAFTDYTMQAGSFIMDKKLQDADIMIGLDRFTRLYRISHAWSNRNFLSVNFTRQFRTMLNEPLRLQSSFGLPYFRNNTDAADARGTARFESVFYNTHKLLGFRFAPFVFSDVSCLKPLFDPAAKTKGYTAVGGGFRTRNENLVFGTIEVRGYYFPRTYPGMPAWKIEFNTNIRFKYNSSFIRRPDIISPN